MNIAKEREERPETFAARISIALDGALAAALMEASLEPLFIMRGADRLVQANKAGIELLQSIGAALPEGPIDRAGRLSWLSFGQPIPGPGRAPEPVRSALPWISERRSAPRGPRCVRLSEIMDAGDERSALFLARVTGSRSRFDIERKERVTWRGPLGSIEVEINAAKAGGFESAADDALKMLFDITERAERQHAHLARGKPLGADPLWALSARRVEPSPLIALMPPPRVVSAADAGPALLCAPADSAHPVSRQPSAVVFSGSAASALPSSLARTALDEDFERRVRQAVSERDSALESARIGGWDLDLIAKTSQRSPEHDRCFGYSRPVESWSPVDFVQSVHPLDRDRVSQELAEAMKGGYFDSQFRVIWPDGSCHWLWSRGRVYLSESGEPARATGAVMEITETREKGERLAHQANHDALTGLPNRALFNDRLEQTAKNARRRDARLAVVYLDADRFKEVNDSLGHSAGDELLREIARRLERCKREEDTVSRLGGDEFAILCPDAQGVEDVSALLARVYKAMEEPALLGGRQIACSLSAGAAIFPQDAEDTAELLNRADVALYEAKRAGRARFAFYEPGMEGRARVGASLEADFKRALSDGQLSLEYQPRLCVSSGALLGVEALCRWTHPCLGSQNAQAVISIAEQTGEIAKLGEWALKSACDQARLWRSAGLAPVPISVNASKLELRQNGFAQRAARALEEGGLSPGDLSVEFDESALGAQAARAAIEQLSALGVGVWVDGFGAGCSCMGHLADLPLDGLKIDAELMERALAGGKPEALVISLCAMAKSLGMRAVAKGVESARALSAAKRWGCDSAQGYHCAPPMSSRVFLSWALARQPLPEGAQNAAAWRYAALGDRFFERSASVWGASCQRALRSRQAKGTGQSARRQERRAALAS